MDRRQFLLGVVGLATSAALPALPAGTRSTVYAHVSRASLERVCAELGGTYPPEWYYIGCHPSVERDIRDLAAREEWTFAWRRAREAGDRDLHPREVMAKYARPTAIGELGSFGGFRFVEHMDLPAIYPGRSQPFDFAGELGAPSSAPKLQQSLNRFL